MNTFWRVVWIVARKDLAIEARSRELINTTLFFALSCVDRVRRVVRREGRRQGARRCGGRHSVGRHRLLRHAGTRPHVRARAVWRHAPRAADGARALGRPSTSASSSESSCLLIATEMVVVPLVALLFQASLFDHLLLMGALLLFGTIGFASVGTLFAAMLARARSRDVLLPILLYPVTIPVMIAGVRGTGALLAARTAARHGAALDHAAAFV